MILFARAYEMSSGALNIRKRVCIAIFKVNTMFSHCNFSNRIKLHVLIYSVCMRTHPGNKK